VVFTDPGPYVQVCCSGDALVMRWCCSVLQCGVVVLQWCCSVLQCVAVCCSVASADSGFYKQFCVREGCLLFLYR